MTKSLGILKKETVDDMQRPSFTSCAAIHIHNVQRQLKGRDVIWEMEKDYKFHVVGQTKYVKILRQELMKIKEI